MGQRGAWSGRVEAGRFGVLEQAGVRMSLGKSGGGQGVPKGGVNVSEGLRKSPEVLRTPQLIQGVPEGYP